MASEPLHDGRIFRFKPALDKANAKNHGATTSTFLPKLPTTVDRKRRFDALVMNSAIPMVLLPHNNGENKQSNSVDTIHEVVFDESDESDYTYYPSSSSESYYSSDDSVPSFRKGSFVVPDQPRRFTPIYSDVDFEDKSGDEEWVPAPSLKASVNKRESPEVTLDYNQHEFLMSYLLQADPGKGIMHDDVEAAVVDTGLTMAIVKKWMNENAAAPWYRLFLSQRKKIRANAAKPKILKRDMPVAAVGPDRPTDEHVPEISREVWLLSPAAAHLHVSTPTTGMCDNSCCRKYDILYPGPYGPNTLCKQCNTQWSDGCLTKEYPRTIH